MKSIFVTLSPDRRSASIEMNCDPVRGSELISPCAGSFGMKPSATPGDPESCAEVNRPYRFLALGPWKSWSVSDCDRSSSSSSFSPKSEIGSTVGDRSDRLDGRLNRFETSERNDVGVEMFWLSAERLIISVDTERREVQFRICESCLDCSVVLAIVYVIVKVN